MKPVFIALLFFLTTIVSAESRELSLNYLTPEEAVGLLTPILRDSENISVVQGRVFLESSLSSYDRARRLLQKADIPGETLLIHIRKAGKHRKGPSDAVSRPAVKAGGDQVLRLPVGQAYFVETGKGVASLGIEPGFPGYPGIRAQLGAEGFYLMVRINGEKVILRASEPGVRSEYLTPATDDLAELPLFAQGRVNEWIALSEPSSAVRPSVVYQIRVENP